MLRDVSPQNFLAKHFCCKLFLSKVSVAWLFIVTLFSSTFLLLEIFLLIFFFNIHSWNFGSQIFVLLRFSARHFAKKILRHGIFIVKLFAAVFHCPTFCCWAIHRFPLCHRNYCRSWTFGVALLLCLSVGCQKKSHFLLDYFISSDFLSYVLFVNLFYRQTFC